MADEPETTEVPTSHLVVEGASDPDDAALEALFRTGYRDLVLLARLLVDLPEDAEEVVQEAFARALASWSRVRDKQHPAAYLRAVVVNVSRDRLRRRRVARRRTTTSRPAEDLDPRRSPGSASSQPSGEGLRAGDSDLADALHRLPRRQRECVVLRFADDCSTAETASVLGISEGSVKTHLHRGLAALQRLLEEP